MSEPHELEERAEVAWAAEQQKWLISGDGERVFSLDDAGIDDPPRFAGLRSECEAFVRAYCLRAVLALVRQEQESIITEEMWGGLARDIMMWIDMFDPPYGKDLYWHLEHIGRKDLPDWLLKEIPNIAHVPSKGNRVAAIYRAMIRAWWLSHTAKETSNG